MKSLKMVLCAGILSISGFFFAGVSVANINVTEFNQSCLSGGSIENYPCRGDSITHNQAHSYCVSIAGGTAGSQYMDCMGSFLPFRSSNNQAVGCNVSEGKVLEWGISSSGGSCIGNIPAGTYKNSEKVSVSTHEGSPYMGSSSFICRNGEFYVESGTSICTPPAQSCDLDGANYQWAVSHLGGYRIVGNNFVDENGFETPISSTDWSNLGLVNELNTLRGQNCFAELNSGSINSMEQILIKPTGSNVIENINSGYNFNTFFLTDGVNNWDTKSYMMDYCYDGNIANDKSRERFEIVSNALFNNNLISEERYDLLMDLKCTTYPVDCRGETIRVTENSAVCDFEVPNIKHGNNPLMATEEVSIGTASNPEFFNNAAYHGASTFSCFNGNIIEQSSECYQTSFCQNENQAVVNIGDTRITSVEFGVGNINDEYTDEELLMAVPKSQRDNLKNSCSNKGFANSGVLVEGSIRLESVERNDPPTSDGSWSVSSNQSKSGMSVYAVIENECDMFGCYEDSFPSCTQSMHGNRYLFKFQEIHCEQGSNCRVTSESESVYECSNSGSGSGLSYANVTISGACLYVENPSVSPSNLCSVGSATGFNLNIRGNNENPFGGSQYVWNCESGLVSNECKGGPSSTSFPPNPPSCFSCDEGYSFNSNSGMCEGSSGTETVLTRITYNCNYQDGAIEVTDGSHCSEQVMQYVESAGWIVDSSVGYENVICGHQSNCANAVYNTYQRDIGGSDDYSVCESGFTYNSSSEQCESSQFSSLSYGSCEAPQEDNGGDPFGSYGLGVVCAGTGQASGNGRYACRNTLAASSFFITGMTQEISDYNITYSENVSGGTGDEFCSLYRNLLSFSTISGSGSRAVCQGQVNITVEYIPTGETRDVSVNVHFGMANYEM